MIDSDKNYIVINGIRYDAVDIDEVSCEHCALIYHCPIEYDRVCSIFAFINNLAPNTISFKKHKE